MTIINFFALGTRWRATPVTIDMLTVPVVPGPGLLFASVDGEIRYLALPNHAVPVLDVLLATSNADLATLVQSAETIVR